MIKNDLKKLNYSQILEKYNLTEDVYSLEHYESDVKEVYSLKSFGITFLEILVG